MKLNIKSKILWISGLVFGHLIGVLITDLCKYPDHKIDETVKRFSHTIYFDFNDEKCENNICKNKLKHKK